MRFICLFALLFFIGLATADTGLVVYYNMSTGSGATALDASGNLNNLTITGNNWTTGMNYQSPYALLFNGTNLSYAKSQKNINITGSSSRTMSLYVKLTNTSATQAIAGWGDNTANGNFYAYALGGYWHLNYFGSDMYFGAVSTSWTHIAVTYDGTTINGYVNGGLINSTAAALNSPNANLSVGYRLVDNSSWLNGTVDEIKVWNRTLTATEVLNEYTKYCPVGLGSYIITYNESTVPSEVIGFSFIATNSTNTFIVKNVSATYWTDYSCNSTFPIGAITLAVSNSSFYSPRYYYPTIATGGSLATTAFLLPFSDIYAKQVTFFVQSGVGAPIVNAAITVNRNFGSGYVTIAQGVTDTLGSAAFVLDSSVQYQVVFSAAGYTSLILTVTPTEPIYTIMLSNTATGNVATGNVLTNMSFSVTPVSRMITSNNTFMNINYTVSSNDSQLQWYGMNVSYNGALQYTVNQTSSTGGSVNYTFNTSVLTNNTVTLYIWFQKNNFSMFIDPIIYIATPYNTSGLFSLSGALALIKQGQTQGGSADSSFALGFLAILITVLVAGYVSVFVNIGAGAFVSLLMLTFFQSWNFFGANSVQIFGALWLLAISWFVLRYV